ncbi:tetratricopeptide repeat protein [Microcoleus sp. N9_A1]|uniref:tetratricopeptide repeat protein n=1 Tax=Microcoleus sp. N9_A1 TaxID=3055380 RepID=UPI002FD12E6C
MIRQIWQRILNLWRQIQRRFRKQPAPPPPKPTPIRTFGEYEQKFMALLEGVEQGWSRGEIKGFLIGSKIKDAEWVNWLQEFGERLLVSPETHLELGGRMVRLGEMNCGRISEVAGNIGRELLPPESLNPAPADVSVVVSENMDSELVARESFSFPTPEFVASENIVSELVARESFSFPTPEFVATEYKPTWPSESLGTVINKEAERLFIQGKKCYYAGDLQGAIAACEKALEIDPKYVDAWNGLGDTLNDLGRNSDAIAAFETALKIDPRYHYAWNGLGWVLNDLGRNSDAIAAFKKALKIDPKYHYAWNGLGWALNDLGHYSEAIGAYEKALEINPKYVDAWNRLGITLKYWRRYSKAIAAFNQALEITGDQYAPAWANRGWAFLSSGRYSKAIENWDEGLQKYQLSNHDYRLACGKFHQYKGIAHYKYGKKKLPILNLSTKPKPATNKPANS